MGIKMNEYGLFRGEELIPCRDEAEIFAAVGLEFVPPEMREDQGEIEAALHGGVPKNLLALSDLKGALHVHTTASDGRDSLESLVTGAVALGWQYIGISDHAAGSLRPTGLDAAKLAAQRREIEQLRRRLPQIGILHGIEVEVLADGRLDADDGMLAECDFVIAAFHAGFQLSREDQTRRLLGAIDHPRTTILGHPTSRILLHRRGIEADWQVIFEAAARHGVVVEIDSHPQRMDLDGMGARAARDKGALLCISPDAHDVAGLTAVRYGVGLARRGWIGPQDVLNTQSFEAVQARLRQHHGSAAPHP
jgi:DNA polymerase (family 10)